MAKKPIFDVGQWQWGRDLPRWQQVLFAALITIGPPLLGYLVGRLARSDEVSPAFFTLVLLLTLGLGVALGIVGKELRKKSELQRDQVAAKAIQEHFNPATLPVVEGFDFSGSCRSFMEIGGDYFDVIRVNDDQLLVTISDVSGKGTAAALVMASIHAILQTQADAQRSVTDIARRLNTYVYRHTSMERFVTMAFGLLRISTREFEYINAGHNPPLLIHPSGGFQALESSGPPLGLLEEVDYVVGRVRLEPGSSLILYTDGLAERSNEKEEQFGEQRIIDCAAKVNENDSAKEVLTAITKANNAFAGKQPHDDDSTLLVIRSLATGNQSQAARG